jgi:transposase InsO family protein
MPWKETSPVEERIRFVTLANEGTSSIAELCRLFGISRKTGYKWLSRQREGGTSALADRSKRPRTSPHAFSQALVKAIVLLRRRHPRMGPKKLWHELREASSQKRLPSVGTIANVLKRYGLSKPPRRRRAKAIPRPQPFLSTPTKPNELWCADFKGEFKTQDGETCWPLTITDAATRFVIAVVALSATTLAESIPVFEAAFRRYGLPRAIRTDNGTPFSSRSLGGMTALSALWVRLGIRIERTRLGKPSDNGRHERFHRTLKEETAMPPARDLASQQAVFDAFVEHYNFKRRHEALGQIPPGRLYKRSPRTCPPTIPPLKYPGHFYTRELDLNGHVRLRPGVDVYVGTGLKNQPVGFEELRDRRWRIHYGWYALGEYDEKTRTVTPYGAQSPNIRRSFWQIERKGAHGLKRGPGVDPRARAQRKRAAKAAALLAEFGEID